MGPKQHIPRRFIQNFWERNVLVKLEKGHSIQAVAVQFEIDREYDYPMKKEVLQSKELLHANHRK